MVCCFQITTKLKQERELVQGRAAFHARHVPRRLPGPQHPLGTCCAGSWPYRGGPRPERRKVEKQELMGGRELAQGLRATWAAQHGRRIRTICTASEHLDRSRIDAAPSQDSKSTWQAYGIPCTEPTGKLSPWFPCRTCHTEKLSIPSHSYLAFYLSDAGDLSGTDRSQYAYRFCNTGIDETERV